MSADTVSYLPNVFKGSETISIQDAPASSSDQPLRNPEPKTQQPSSISEEELLERISGGCRESLGLLFKLHARQIRHIAQRILRDTSEADDLLQDVFLFIFRKAALFDPAKGSARSWIFQVAYHRAFNRRHYLTARQHYRVLQLNEEILGPGAFSAETPNGSSPIDAIFNHELLAQCRTVLSPDQMRTLELFFFEGYTLKEIAEHTGHSLSNVRSYYYRGLERLRKLANIEKARTT